MSRPMGAGGGGNQNLNKIKLNQWLHVDSTDIQTTK